MEEVKPSPRAKKERETIELPLERVGAEPEDKQAKQAREKKAAKKKDEKEPEPKWWNDGRLSKISGLSLILFSFILLVAFTSYLFTVADDQSEVLSAGVSALGDKTVHVSNALGRLGAWLAHAFINNMFG